MYVESGTLREGWTIAPATAVIPDPDDSGLIALARNGDRSAFERLYRRYVGRVHGLCRRLTGHAAEAEDMTQEVFVRAWQKLATFEGRSPFAAWLRRIAINVVISERRARGRTISSGPLEEDPPVADSPAPQRSAGLRRDLEEAIGTLPEGARMVFVLHDVYGYRHEEIADWTGTAVGTSKAHLHRARRLLREALSE